MRIKTMIASALVALAISVSANAEFEKSIDFSGQQYSLAFEQNDPKTQQIVVEYLPQGETLEKFNEMLSYYEYLNVEAKNIESLVSFLAKDTEQPITSRTLLVNKDEADGNYYLIKIARSGNTFEYVVYRFMPKDDHVVSYFYSKRAYTEDEKWFEEVSDENLANTLLQNLANLKPM